MLLALRALADPRDGVAEAALLGPPFFAVDPADLAAERGAASGGQTAVNSGQTASSAAEPAAAGLAERLERVREARCIVDELRAARLGHLPGAVARDLIERTGLGRRVICGPNGNQILAMLYEVASHLDRIARERRLDYDAASALLREWAERPIYHDAPSPLDAAAVQVMTIHQAKGLEFPVVILWDGFAGLGRLHPAPWKVGREGASWALKVEDLERAEPDKAAFDARQRQLEQNETRRLIYVAATRARDLLVLTLPRRATSSAAAKSKKKPAKPYASGKDNILVSGALYHEIGAELESSVQHFDEYRRDAVPAWAELPADEGGAEDELVADPAIDESLADAREQVTARLAAATRPIAMPGSMSRAARATEAAGAVEAPSRGGVSAPEAEGDEPTAALGWLDGDAEEADLEREPAVERWEKHRRARFGPAFGTAVHRALQLCLETAAGEVGERVDGAVRIAALEASIDDEQRLAATRDVHNALGALAREGLMAQPRRAEHPVTLHADGRLYRGVIDLLVVGDETAWVIDYKTDAKQPGSLAAAYPHYARQLDLYGEAVTASGLLGERDLRLGILLTERGDLLWL
jgi:ATP-dependent helicase/nuclease subunit A